METSLSALAVADFERVEMRLGRIVAADPFPRARKPAYRLQPDRDVPLGGRVF